MIDTSDMDPELARYLNRNYWQQKSESNKSTTTTTQPSAPVAQAEPKNTQGGGKVQEVHTCFILQAVFRVENQEF